MTRVAVVLAAGKSTRMRSRLPKAAHPIVGRPMLAHVLFAAHAALRSHPSRGASHAHDDTEDHSSQLVVVLGHEAAQIEQALQATPEIPPFHVAMQERQLGTGDAVRAAQSLLAPSGAAPLADTVLVLYGDSPLVRPETLAHLLATHERSGATVTFLTAHATRDTGYGRVLRNTAGMVQGIIEERHCTPEQLRITEVNSGIYCFRAGWLWSRLSQLRAHDSGEYYLTDLVDLAAAEGAPVETISAPLSETAGVNDRIQLSEATAVLQRRILDDLMRSGVTIVNPATTYVDAGVRVGMDTTIYPCSSLQGATVIGEDCVIGPHSSVRDSTVGDHCAVIGSWLESAVMDSGSQIGPMGHLRPGARLESGAFLGNFGEVKNATIGRNVKMHHFGFVGDATIGADSNVGAGVITVNYDGQAKQHTEVGEGAFLGCDTLLIAPVSVGADATTGAGSVVTRNVPDGGVAVGLPARVIRRNQPRRHRQEPPSAATPADVANAHSPHANPSPPAATSQGRQSAQDPTGGASEESRLDG